MRVWPVLSFSFSKPQVSSPPAMMWLTDMKLHITRWNRCHLSPFTVPTLKSNKSNMTLKLYCYYQVLKQPAWEPLILSSSSPVVTDRGRVPGIGTVLNTDGSSKLLKKSALWNWNDPPLTLQAAHDTKFYCPKITSQAHQHPPAHTCPTFWLAGSPTLMSPRWHPWRLIAFRYQDTIVHVCYAVTQLRLRQKMN